MVARWIHGLTLVIALGASGCGMMGTAPSSMPAALQDEDDNPPPSTLERTFAPVAEGLTFIFWDVPKRLYDYATGETPGKYARKMYDAKFPDERRVGTVWIVSHDYGRREPYVNRYRQLYTLDSDYSVRAMALRALNISRDRQSTRIFIEALSDKNEQIRLEGAKALANIPDDTAVTPLLRTLGNSTEDRDVRIAAADALRHYKTLQVARSLVSVLQEREFGVAWQARRSLVRMTGTDLEYDEAAWLNYLSGPAKPLG